jgi:hypothetical protein
MFLVERNSERVDPSGECALDGFLPQREEVVVARRKVTDVERIRR